MQNAMKKADEREMRTAGDARSPDVPQPRRRAVAPRCDIRETSEAIVVVADMPGVDDAAVDITLHKGVLTVRGSVQDEAPEGFRLVLGEYEPLDYERSFTLADAIDQEHVAAHVANGVLTLTLPKATSAQPRRIAVRAG